MFRVKICGVTNLDDAQAAVDFGADAIGLNFYSKSKRYVEPNQAAAIAEGLRGKVLVVGVFVNEPVPAIQAIVKAVGLNAVQLHGDETPAAVASFGDTPVIRARRVGPDGISPIAADLSACREVGKVPDAVLLDAAAGSSFGGTGTTLDWSVVAKHKEVLGSVPLALAGGLKPSNVAEAIRTAEPFGVDVASGVEVSPGIKDTAEMREFIETVRSILG